MPDVVAAAADVGDEGSVGGVVLKGNASLDEQSAATLRDLLDQGFVVAATDYHGLGTPGVHTYHHSEEMAHATTDSVVRTFIDVRDPLPTVY